MGDWGLGVWDWGVLARRSAGLCKPCSAAAHFGWFIHFAAADMAASSAKTRAELGWNPAGPKLLPDMDRPIYFQP